MPDLMVRAADLDLAAKAVYRQGPKVSDAATLPDSPTGSGTVDPALTSAVAKWSEAIKTLAGLTQATGIALESCAVRYIESEQANTAASGQ